MTTSIDDWIPAEAIVSALVEAITGEDLEVAS